jgi:hypothetical protein
MTLSAKQILLAGALAAALLLGTALFPSLTNASWLTLNPYQGAPQSTLGVNGWGFGAHEGIDLSLGSTTAHATTDSGGAFSGVNLLVPQLPAGSYAVHAHGASSGSNAEAGFYVSGFYPKAAPSAWYLLPGQTLSVSGSNFAPGERITISGDITASATADASGSFSGAGSLTVPYSWQNGSHSFTVAGDRSAYAIPITVKVGSFYPDMSPSSYYVARSQAMSVHVTGFAPGEQVTMTVGGASADTRTADGSGAADFSITAPSSGSSFLLTAQGVSSGTSVTRTVTLMQ